MTWTTSEWQTAINDWVSKRKTKYFTPHQILARLTSEVGEFATEINHKFGPLQKKPGDKPSSDLEEAGDIAFTLICYLNSQKKSLHDALSMALKKCYGRDKNRFPMVENAPRLRYIKRIHGPRNPWPKGKAKKR